MLAKTLIAAVKQIAAGTGPPPRDHRQLFNLATVERTAHCIHLGAKLEEGLYSEETRRHDALARLGKIQDGVRAGFDPATFERLVNRLNAAAATKIHPTSALDFAVSEQAIPKSAREDVLRHFLGESAAGLYGETVLGFVQGLTRYAQTLPGEDAASLEDWAGKHLAQPKTLAQVSSAALVTA